MSEENKVIVIPPPVYPEGSQDVLWKEHYCDGTGRMAITPVSAKICTSCDKAI